MPFLNPKPALFLTFLFCGIANLAVLRPAQAAEEEGKKEEGGKPATETPKDQREYSEKQAKLNVLQNHIEEADKHFKELVHAKEEAKTATEKQAMIKEMVELTHQRNQDVQALNKLKADLNFRYPDMGDRLNKTYQTQSKRSVEEMEGAAGLDEMLTRTKKQVDKKYAPFLPADDKSVPKTQASKPEGDKPARLKLEK